MTGVYLRQLLDALLALRPALDRSLALAGLQPVRDMATEPVEVTERRPLLTVSLAGPRVLARPFQQGRAERVPVTVALWLDLDEPQALVYEGVLKATLEDGRETVRAAVTDAVLSTLELVGAASGEDVERENAESWLVTVQLEALLQW